jgi:hypothetical protein
MNRHATVYTLHHRSTVRHLLIEGDDNGAKTLSKLEDGERTVVATGTHYEMDQKATSVMREWIKNEGFRYRKDGDPPVFESLEAIVALTTSVGYQHIYDPNYKTMRNMLGQVPLAQWQGRKDTLGNDCEYGFTGTTIYVQPRVTANHGVNMKPKDNQELMETFRKAIAIRKSLGPEQELVIG